MTIFGISIDQWIQMGISVVIVLGTIILGRWVIVLVLDRLVKRLLVPVPDDLRDTILNTLRTPLYLLVVVIAFRIALVRLETNVTGPPWLDVFFLLNFIVIAVFVWNLTSRLFVWYGSHLAPRTETNLDQQLIPFFRRIALLVLSSIGLIIILGHFDVDVSALVTTLGIGSLAIALAAQETLADTITGFVIMLDRPYRIGDRIELQELDTWGDVVDIGLRSSRIRTIDNRMVVVPNSVIGKSLIVNHSYPNTQYRIQTHVGVAYGVDLESARETLVSATEGVEGVLKSRPVEALFDEFGDSSLNFRVRWWIDSYQDAPRMYDRINTAIYIALEEAGIEIPFPQRDIHHYIDQPNLDRLSQIGKG
jgi:small-conductance mechanosensitive channel